MNFSDQYFPWEGLVVRKDGMLRPENALSHGVAHVVHGDSTTMKRGRLIEGCKSMSPIYQPFLLGFGSADDVLGSIRLQIVFPHSQQVLDEVLSIEALLGIIRRNNGK